MTHPTPADDVRPFVRKRYADAALRVISSEDSGCGCGSSSSSCCAPGCETGAGTANALAGYSPETLAELPEEVRDLSLGCGDPVSLAALEPGQTVLDMGSGGGIDCFLAARQVGPQGKVIGVDMTPEMLERARANLKKLGLPNVEFRLGEIEHLPVADASVDVVISNCVVNLSPDKAQVLREAYRVLKPGGKLVVSDIVTQGPLPDAVRNNLRAWAECVAGALDVQEYTHLLQEAGFEQVQVEPVYLEKALVDEAAAGLEEEVRQAIEAGVDVYKAVFSARIMGRKMR